MDGEWKRKSAVGDESCSRREIVADGSSRLRSVVTYRRRMNTKVVEDGTVLNDSDTKLAEKSVKSFTDQVNQKMPHTVLNTSSGFSLKHQRNIVLEQIRQSLEIEHGLEKCIQAALTFHPGSGSRTTVKESVHSCEAGSKGTVQMQSTHHGLGYAPKSNVDKAPSVSANGSKHNRITEFCQRTMFDIITSEKFALLCNLFLENGMTAEKLFDLRNINSQMKGSAYETCPMLFHTDVQQAGSFAQSASNNGKDEFPTQESDMDKADDVAEASTPHELHKCRHCGQNSDGRNSLVCDSCEEMYHISCIHPAVKEIPSSSWYCAKCTSNKIECPHDNCVACERLNASTSPFDTSAEDNVACDLTLQELEESSNELDQIVKDENCKCCKIWQTEVKTEEGYQICGHSFCLNKLYHVRCLTSKQLVSYGSCWYCPSCLCRACFIDRGDDKIVMCDGCDHTYHIYCMQPPQTTIPKGKWFCMKCEEGLKRLNKAKVMYENIQNNSKKRSLGGESKAEV